MVNKPKTSIIIQARVGSKRFPRKALLKISGKTIFELVVERVKRVRGIDKIILATSVAKENNELVAAAGALGIDYFQGSEENVLDRIHKASAHFNSDIIIRVTCDNPMIDPDLVQKGLKIFYKGKYDILSNVRVMSYPYGLNFEIFTKEALEYSWHKHKAEMDEEKKSWDTFIDVTEYIFKNSKFKKYDFVSPENLAHIRVTLDYPEDYIVIKTIHEALYAKNNKFGLKDIISYLSANPDLLAVNKKYNEYAKA